ncbi:MAG: hypothetical protein ACKOAU_15665 [Pirellula sp.]
MNDPYEFQESEIAKLERQPTLSAFRIVWGVLLLSVALIGNFIFPSFGLGEFEGSFVIGIWIAQYVVVWLWMYAHLHSKLSRFMLGMILTVFLSVAEIIGMMKFWSPVPPEVIGIIILEGIGIHLIAGWIMCQLFRRSNFNLEPDQEGSRGQYSLRGILASMVVSAILAMVAKWIGMNSQGTRGFYSLSDLVMIAVWFVWLDFGLGILAFLQVGAMRSSSRWFYRPLFFLVLILGPFLFQLVGLWIVGYSDWFVLRRMEWKYVLIAYLVEAGIVLGIFTGLPLLPKRSGMVLRELTTPES